MLCDIDIELELLSQFCVLQATLCFLPSFFSFLTEICCLFPLNIATYMKYACQIFVPISRIVPKKALSHRVPKTLVCLLNTEGIVSVLASSKRISLIGQRT